MRIIGFLLISVATIILLLCMFYLDDTENNFIRALLTVVPSVCLPLGLSFLFFNSETKLFDLVLRIFQAVSLLLILGGIALQLVRNGNAFIFMLTGALGYTFAYAPLQLKKDYNQWQSLSQSKFYSALLSIINFYGVSALVIGTLFKLMHWRGANFMLISGMVVAIASLWFWNYLYKKVMLEKIEIEKNIKYAFDELDKSITYATRIQKAKLPRTEVIYKKFQQSFVLYKPKEKMSGDFYFYSEPGSNACFIAAADCTGHGIPGAILSMVGSEKLFEHSRPHATAGQVLMNLNNGLRASLRLRDNNSGINDGMDIAICRFNEIDNQLTTIEFAGAKRPLLIVRKDSTEIEEIKGNKTSIGEQEADESTFTTHTINLNKGDTIYLTSDGYADTFSAADKKLTTKKFKQMLIDIQTMTMDEQAKHLDDFIEKWKGGCEQTDDILVIGVRV
ncbi:MAG: SpoIIE family protein phosphatase [Bacteroidetes bacterium]|nr:SpoIIE family protein phosphatase [Bacteroidota bacterium]